MKNDIGYFYDINREINMKHFVEVLWALLASKSKTIDFNRPNVLVASLPTDYKKVIEIIMTSNNSWPIKFSKLIDINFYFERQHKWEQNLSMAMEKYIETKNKVLKYDFQFDYIELEFTKEEVQEILLDYEEEFLNIMDHFVNLIQSFKTNRYHDLGMREAERNVRRKFIQVSDTSFSRTWE